MFFGHMHVLGFRGKKTNDVMIGLYLLVSYVMFLMF